MTIVTSVPAELSPSVPSVPACSWIGRNMENIRGLAGPPQWRL